MDYKILSLVVWKSNKCGGDYIMVKKWNIRLAITLLSLLGLGLSVPAFAQTDVLKELNRFHMTIGLGYSKIMYPEGFSDLTELFDSHIGGINYNVGLYYQLPANESISLGGNASGAIDSYSGGLFGTASMRLDHNLFAISSMLFPSKKFGIGPFVRADVGLARMKANFSDLFWEDEVSAESDFGFGILLGGGIAFPITQTSKAAISANFSFSKIEDDNYKLLSISLNYIY